MGYYPMVFQMKVIDDFVDLIRRLATNSVSVLVRAVKEIVIQAFYALVGAVVVGVCIRAHQKFWRLCCLHRLVCVLVALDRSLPSEVSSCEAQPLSVQPVAVFIVLRKLAT